MRLSQDVLVQSQKDKEAQDLKLFKDLQQKYQQLEAQRSQAVRQLALECSEGKEHIFSP